MQYYTVSEYESVFVIHPTQADGYPEALENFKKKYLWNSYTLKSKKDRKKDDVGDYEDDLKLSKYLSGIGELIDLKTIVATGEIVEIAFTFDVNSYYEVKDGKKGNAGVPELLKKIFNYLKYSGLYYRDYGLQCTRRIKYDLFKLSHHIMDNRSNRNESEDIHHRYIIQCEKVSRDLFEVDNGWTFDRLFPEESASFIPYTLSIETGEWDLNNWEKKRIQIQVHRSFRDKQSVINEIKRHAVATNGSVIFRGSLDPKGSVSHAILYIYNAPKTPRDEGQIKVYDPNAEIGATIDAYPKKFQDYVDTAWLEITDMFKATLVPLEMECINDASLGRDEFYRCFDEAKYGGYCEQITSLIMMCAIITGNSLEVVARKLESLRPDKYVSVVETYIGMEINIHFNYLLSTTNDFKQVYRKVRQLYKNRVGVPNRTPPIRNK